MTTKQPTSSTALLGASTGKERLSVSTESTLPSTATTTLKKNNKNDDDDAETAATSSTSMTAFEYIETENHSVGEASNVELFSDLTVVVAIHVLSDLLTEVSVEEEEQRNNNP